MQSIILASLLAILNVVNTLRIANKDVGIFNISRTGLKEENKYNKILSVS